MAISGLPGNRVRDEAGESLIVPNSRSCHCWLEYPRPDAPPSVLLFFLFVDLSPTTLGNMPNPDRPINDNLRIVTLLLGLAYLMVLVSFCQEVIGLSMAAASIIAVIVGAGLVIVSFAMFFETYTSIPTERGFRLLYAAHSFCPRLPSIA